jgi:CBS domain containing-hemolysin-like protein
MLILAGLASASETALNSVSRISIRRYSEAGDQRAQLVARLIHNPNTYLTTILIINSVAVIVASTLATLIALNVFAAFGEVISTIVLALIVLIFCEIAPKTAAVQNPDRWARTLATPVFFAYTILRPVIATLTWLTSGIVRLLGGRTVRHGPFVTEEDLRMLVDVGEEEGVLEEDEKDILHNVFGFSDKTVREIMVPRIDMITIEADEPIDDGVGLILQGGQSRIPVYSASIDNVIGVLYAKDLLRVLATGHHPDTVRSLVRPAYFVPETKHLDDLLHELQQQRVHMAIVNDEYGQVAGLVTIEDLIEEILGDIQDEYDREETVYEQIGPDEYLVDAKISIDDFNDLMDTSLKSEDYDTLGGFVYSRLDKIPSVGDAVRDVDMTYTVLGTRGRRVTKVKVVRGKVDATEREEQSNRPHEVFTNSTSLDSEPSLLQSPATSMAALPSPSDVGEAESASVPARSDDPNVGSDSTAEGLPRPPGTESNAEGPAPDAPARDATNTTDSLSIRGDRAPPDQWPTGGTQLPLSLAIEPSQPSHASVSTRRHPSGRGGSRFRHR